MKLSPTIRAALLFLALISVLFWHLRNREEQLKNRAMIIMTRSLEKMMSMLLNEAAVRAGGLTNLSAQFISNTIFKPGNTGFHSNTVGQVVDVWKTPFEIQLVGRTTFLFRSAGRNCQFGDADDIVFNSASDQFVEP